MDLSTVKTIGRSDFVAMGQIQLRQPIPSKDTGYIDPFILLHHYGPYEISEAHNPFDLGPHPHRGFEPITFLIQGEQLHRDSLGNESIVKAGDVQWTTAGRGIIHAEAPTKDFVTRGGTLEGIQLWLNLPAAQKMIAPNYQHVADADFRTVSDTSGSVKIQVIAGQLEGVHGRIATQTPVNAFMLHLDAGATYTLPVPKTHQSALYLIKGEVQVNDSVTLELDKNQLIQFNTDGDGFSIQAKTKSMLLFLSGVPFNEPVKTYGPYVMNTQSELMEAMRDYQMGKMGFLPA